MQCTGENRVAFPLGKRAAVSRCYPAAFLFLFVFLGFFLFETFSCFRTTGCEAYSFTADGYGIFNVRAKLGPCRAHAGWGGGLGGVWAGTSKSAHRVGSDGQNKCLSPCPGPPGDQTQGLQI